MRFFRHRLGTHEIDIDRLRVLSSRHGWLVETPNVLRAGFGACVISATLPDGIAGSLDGAHVLRDAEIDGESAPSGIGPLAFSSIPFDRDGAVRLWVPEHVITRSDDAGTWLTSTNPDKSAALALIDAVSLDNLDIAYAIDSTEALPSPDGYARLVAAAVEEMRSTELEKVVLAREVRGTTSLPIDPAVVATRLNSREPACTLFAVPGLPGGRFVGASPEMLISVIDGSVDCHPLAGTVALSDEDDAVDYPKWLLGSTKNLFEHRVVVDQIVTQLRTRCSDVRADARPSIVILRSVAHLGTWVHGKIDDARATHALELLQLLHPTPAVGGLPQDHALRVIERLEPENRGLYAGAVGWFDAESNGEWWIAIRAISLSDNNFSAWAGAGIVSDSDPFAEREETRSKMATILVGLG